MTDCWQLTKEKLTERGQHLLETGLWSDCSFIVGQEPQQQIFKSHKSWLAMSSPVFEAMFFGNLAEKNDPISITDVQPEAFKILLEYIYTLEVTLTSFKLACDVHYCAQKYILPYLTKECINYLMSNLSYKNVCMTYEFAVFFKECKQECELLDKCLQIICTSTQQIIEESTWEQVKLSTILTILDQENLHVDSEVELLLAVEQWAMAECRRQFLDPTDGKSLRSVIGNAMSKIKFLRCTPKEFAEHAGVSPLLTKDEAFALLMNILCWNIVPMPEGFSLDC